MQNLKELTDEEIVKLVISKDKNIYNELVKRYENKLLRYVKYITNNSHKAEDVVQETFIKTFINLKGFNKKLKFSSWIYRIAHNEAINALEKHKKEVKIDENIFIDEKENLELELDKKIVMEKVKKCLNKISLLYREPVSLFYLEEKSYEEISDILRIPIGTVGTRINRAKLLMKKLCQKI